MIVLNDQFAAGFFGGMIMSMVLGLLVSIINYFDQNYGIFYV